MSGETPAQGPQPEVDDCSGSTKHCPLYRHTTCTVQCITHMAVLYTVHANLKLNINYM